MPPKRKKAEKAQPKPTEVKKAQGKAVKADSKKEKASSAKAVASKAPKATGTATSGRPTRNSLKVFDSGVVDNEMGDRMAEVDEGSAPPSIEAPKRKRRSREEVAAVKEVKLASKKRMRDLHTEAQAAFEAMEAAEDVARAKAEASAIRRMSDIIEVPTRRARAQHDDSDGEYVDINDISEASDEEEEEDVETAPTVETPLDPQDLRRQLEALKAQMALLKGGGKVGQKANTNLRDENTLGIASGLKPAFKATKTVKAPLKIESRGISDDDSTDDEADCASSPGTNRGIVREVVTSTRQDVTVVDVSNPKARERKPKKVVTRPVPAPAPLRRTYAAIDVTTPAARERSTTPKPPAAQFTTTATNTTQDCTSTDVGVQDLPSFLQTDNSWKRRVLPTLYHRLYTSTKPFATFTLGSKALVSAVQDVVEAVHPEMAYTVRHQKDPVLLLSYNRFTEKRSAIAAQAVKQVAAKLKSFKSSDDAVEWLAWAKCITGPLYFRDPAPLRAANTDAQAPSGRLESSFIVALAQFAFKSSRNAVITKNDRPVGLLADLHLELERATNVLDARGDWLSDKKGKNGEFSQTAWGKQVEDYATGLQDVSEAKWDSILKLCCPDDAPQANALVTSPAPIHDKDRRSMFSFESPRKL
ncbi:hypothetical protein CC2G_003524 [Coprinopsis cinerea AmutBmut pab1-1]|nr:hypothetical protein CC2G_003524 [Coprinopsis cinerea AmutBmut pab1-1]